MIREVTMGSLSGTPQISPREGLDIRALVAKHLGVDIRRIKDEAHLRRDLGVVWLDRLELLLLIEDQFADIEIPDDADQIEVVGDLIRCVEDARGLVSGARSLDTKIAAVGSHDFRVCLRG
jgi:acyl carrier protein